MGDWMTVRIVGTCNKNDLPKLKMAVDWDGGDFDNFHCLSHAGGLAGLPMWAQETIDAVGNCAERDYTPQSVAETLREFAEIAPSLNVKVHCGGAHESETCVATVTLENGRITVGDPEVESVGKIAEEQMLANYLKQVQRQARGRQWLK